jgi:phage terminase small subunit
MKPKLDLVIPTGLSEKAQAQWLEINRDSVIDAAAAPILILYLRALDEVDEAQLHIAEEGTVMKDRFGIQKINPWVTRARDSAHTAGKMFRLLGFDQEPRGASH